MIIVPDRSEKKINDNSDNNGDNYDDNDDDKNSVIKFTVVSGFSLTLGGGYDYTWTFNRASLYYQFS